MTNEYSEPIRDGTIQSFDFSVGVPYSHLTLRCVVYFQVRVTNEYYEPIRGGTIQSFDFSVGVPYSHLTLRCVVYFQVRVTNEYSKPTGRYHTVI